YVSALGNISGRRAQLLLTQRVFVGADLCVGPPTQSSGQRSRRPVLPSTACMYWTGLQVSVDFARPSPHLLNQTLQVRFLLSDHDSIFWQTRCADPSFT